MRAAAEMRAHEAQPYLQCVADVRVGAVLAAAVVLKASGTVPALVWDERYGWRTAVSRSHPNELLFDVLVQAQARQDVLAHRSGRYLLLWCTS